jgi:metabotropic glutamate receptor 5
MNTDQLHFTENEPRHPESVCSRPCAYYESRHLVDGEPCCWTCVACTSYQYLPTPFECVDCPLGSTPSSNLTTCLPLPEHYLRYDSTAAIVAMVAAGFGAVVTIYTVVMFIR